MSDDPPPDTIAELLADDAVRTILVEAANEPQSASALTEACEVSGPTVYRRLQTLREYDLVEPETKLDPGGDHYEVYATTLDRVVFDLQAERLTCSVSRRERMADRFTKIVEGL